MKRIFPLLLAFLVGISSAANAQSKPKKARHAFSHSAVAGTGKNDKATFRRENKRPVIDLAPHSQTKFKTAKANKPYKFSKGNGFAKGK
jgi:hypothetical protein